MEVMRDDRPDGPRRSRWPSPYLIADLTFAAGVVLLLLPGNFFYGVWLCVMALLYLCRFWLWSNGHHLAANCLYLGHGLLFLWYLYILYG